MHCVKQTLINAKLQICLRGKKTELIGRIPVRRLISVLDSRTRRRGGGGGGGEPYMNLKDQLVS
jgi:hypothetical protein